MTTRPGAAEGRRIEVEVEIDLLPATNGRQFLGTFWRGALAFTMKKPREANPYREAATFRRYWYDGYEAARETQRRRRSGGRKGGT